MCGCTLLSDRHEVSGSGRSRLGAQVLLCCSWLFLLSCGANPKAEDTQHIATGHFAYTPVPEEFPPPDEDAAPLEKFNTGRLGVPHCDDDPCKKDPRLCTCTPKTCADLDGTAGSKHCGPAVPDGCGGTLNCGECPAPNSCGGGGTPNVCGCTPKSCDELGKSCGSHSDGCGGIVRCGPDCPGPGYCGDKIVSPTEECDGGPCCTKGCRLRSRSHVCRDAIGVCDQAETCTGTSPLCPPDTYKRSTAECRSAAGPCDIPEYCSGDSPFCPSDEVKPSSTVCRPSAGVCDEADKCTGLSPYCPADEMSVGKVCRPVAGICDVAELCVAGSPHCGADERKPAGTICRASTHGCDADEVCGSLASCPADSGRIDPPLPVPGSPWTPPLGVVDVEPSECASGFWGSDGENLSDCMDKGRGSVCDRMEPWGHELFAWCVRRRTKKVNWGSLSTGSLTGAQYRTELLRKWASTLCDGTPATQVYHPESPKPMPEDSDGDGWFEGGAFSCVHRVQCQRVQVITPLVLSFDLNARISLVPDDGQHCFDLSAGSHPLGCRTDWTTPATPWLVLSQSPDGLPRSGADLFSSVRPLPNGTSDNGFVGLAALDDNRDNKLDAQDSAFTQLRLWRDSNGDRVAQLHELQTLQDRGVIELDVRYTVALRADARGNFERERSTFIFRNAQGHHQRGAIVDVYLAMRNYEP